MLAPEFGAVCVFCCSVSQMDGIDRSVQFVSGCFVCVVQKLLFLSVAGFKMDQDLNQLQLPPTSARRD